MSDYLDPDNEELIKDFFVEAETQVEALESNILVLENNPNNPDAVDEIFRAAHTLKGAAATVQMTELAEFTHVVEDTLDEIRSGHVSVNETLVDTLLSAVDVVKEMLDARSNGTTYTHDTSELTEALKVFVAEAQSGSPGGRTADASDAPQDELPQVYGELEQRETQAGDTPVYRVTVGFDESNPMNSVGGIQVYAALKQIGRIVRTRPEFDALYEDKFFSQVEYYVESSSTAEEVEQAATIPDVTDAVDVHFTGAPQPVAQTATESPKSRSDIEPEARASRRETASNGAAQPAESGEADEIPDAVTAAAVDDVRARDLKRSGGSGSILRVESRRIDNLLNLVSETVINKASFNQVSNGFAENDTLLQSSETRFRETLKELFNSMPEFLESIQRGASIKAVKKEIIERFGDLPGVFDGFFAAHKTTVARFRNTAQNLGRIAGELQEGVMRIRMVPISQIFNRFPRLVRDLSRSLNKDVNLVIEGEDTELDKSVIEDLLDPLIHCVRNSIDHGIESSELRNENGKPSEGLLRLKASSEGNMIIIEISDDGRGIDIDAVRAKAHERGVIHPSKTLSDIEAFNLIFDPGFSTAAKITNVSGRGVGLDVVKRQIEKLNGSVTVWSEKGIGTRFTVKIPLTLAIIQGLLVRVGREIYAIPITSVIESHRIKPAEVKRIDNYEVFNVRDDVVSILRLNRLFKIETNENPEYHFVVVVGTGEKKMGLIVDSLIGEEDVVIKPLKDHYVATPGIAGANITGDGTVSLIIDVAQLLELGLRNELEERRRRETMVS
ncbi:MAG: chemotaxis protein CheA [Spirochaetaceae bacterium]|nr:MAG: chemotaxis protein CheA [Spirochaetaceae bacterium]